MYVYTICSFFNYVKNRSRERVVSNFLDSNTEIRDFKVAKARKIKATIFGILSVYITLFLSQTLLVAYISYMISGKFQGVDITIIGDTIITCGTCVHPLYTVSSFMLVQKLVGLNQRRKQMPLVKERVATRSCFQISPPMIHLSLGNSPTPNTTHSSHSFM